MAERAVRTDIAVIGAGPAGIAAACAAAESGRRTVVVDDTPWLGGQIWRGEQARPSNAMARRWLERLSRSGATTLPQAAALFSPREGVLQLERPDGPVELMFNKLVVATGARELFLPFPGWTLPGVVGPGGLQAMAKNGWPVEGKAVAVAGSGPLLLAVADGLRRKGARVVCIVEQAPFSAVLRFGLGLAAHPGKLLAGASLRARLAGVPYRTGCWPVAAQGEGAVQSATFTDGQRQWTERCDLLACAFGLVPNVELALVLGCGLQEGYVAVDALQKTTRDHIYCAGEPTGIGGADRAIVEGLIAGYAAAGRLAEGRAQLAERDRWHRFARALAQAFALRPELKSLAAPDTLVCRCEDVRISRLREFDAWRDAKLQTRCGMGPCQGRVCGAATKVLFGWGMESVRPPVLPARVGSLLASAPNGPGADAPAHPGASPVRP